VLLGDDVIDLVAESRGRLREPAYSHRYRARRRTRRARSPVMRSGSLA
jgi:hypothetical protein